MLYSYSQGDGFLNPIKQKAQHNGNSTKVFTCIVIVVLISQFALHYTLFTYDGTREDQKSIFFDNGKDTFSDTFKVESYVIDRDPYCMENDSESIFDNSSYPAMANLIIYLLTPTESNFTLYSNYSMSIDNLALVRGMFFLMISSLLLYVSLERLFSLHKPANKLLAGILPLALLFSGPFIYAFERGNILIFAIALTTFFLSGYKSENKLVRELSMLSLALAASIKIVPAVFGLLMLLEKEYKATVRLVIYGLTFTVLPFLFFKGGFSAIPVFVSNLITPVAFYEFGYFPRLNYHYFTSYGGLISNKLTVFLWSFMPFCDKALGIFSLASLPFLKKDWQKVACLALPIIILPSNSGTYNILYLFPVLVLLLTDINKTSEKIIALAFLPMLTAMQYMCNYQIGKVTQFELTTIFENLISWGLFAYFGLMGMHIYINKLSIIISKKLNRHAS